VTVATYDSDNRKAVVFTGETWVYDADAETWTRKTTATSPTSLAEQTITYDSKRRVVYLYGGEYPSSNALWAYSVQNNTWTKLQPTGTLPPAGGGYGLAYDKVNDVVLAFGRDNLWVYDPTANQWSKKTTTPNPGTQEEYFVHGRFKYDALNNVAFLVHRSSSYAIDVWAYRYKNRTSTLIPPVTPGPLTVR
jgi:N-acetylneuraminic acid mutarotase